MSGRHFIRRWRWHFKVHWCTHIRRKFHIWDFEGYRAESLFQHMRMQLNILFSWLRVSIKYLLSFWQKSLQEYSEKPLNCLTEWHARLGGHWQNVWALVDVFLSAEFLHPCSFSASWSISSCVDIKRSLFSGWGPHFQVSAWAKAFLLILFPQVE